MLSLGDTNDEFTVVQEGLAPGDRIVLNPSAFVEEAEGLAKQPTKKSEQVSKAADVLQKTALSRK